LSLEKCLPDQEDNSKVCENRSFTMGRHLRLQQQQQHQSVFFVSQFLFCLFALFPIGSSSSSSSFHFDERTNSIFPSQEAAAVAAAAGGGSAAAAFSSSSNADRRKSSIKVFYQTGVSAHMFDDVENTKLDNFTTQLTM
jgi:hypothetical protein